MIGSPTTTLSKLLPLLCVGLAGCTAEVEAPDPGGVRTTASSTACTPVCNVLDFPVAGVNIPRDTSGKHDYTAAFEAAIACSAAKRIPVHVPRGRYRITRPLTLENQLMFGEQAGASFGGNGASCDSLPTLVFPSSKPAYLLLKHQAGLRGVAIKYVRPGDPLTSYVAPDHERPAIRVTGVGVNISAVKIWAPKHGIHAPAGQNVGRLNIEDVFIVAPVRVGVHVGQTLDVSRLRDIHIWNNGTLTSGTVGFKLLRNDYLSTSDLSVFNMDRAFLFENDAAGGATLVTMHNTNIDACAHGLVVGGGATVSLTGGTVITHWNALAVRDKATVTAAGATLTANGSPAVRIAGQASLTLSGSTVKRAHTGFGAHGLEVAGGRTLTVHGNTFKVHGHGVFFHQPLSGAATVVGNSFDLATNPHARGVWGNWGGATVADNNSPNG